MLHLNNVNPLENNDIKQYVLQNTCVVCSWVV